MSTRDTVLRISQELGASRAEQTLFLHIMRAESAGQADARNTRSTATGIFQFLEQTWLAEMNDHGAEHGYARYADAITRGSNGRYYVNDPALRREILNLRTDPEASARMMYEFTEANRVGLRSTLGREPMAGELYLAHFAGLGGAREVLNADPSTPLRSLPIMSRALGANPTIANFTAGRLRAWAIGKMDGDVDAAVSYEAAGSHTREEDSEERRRRREVLSGFGLSDEQIDEIDGEGNLMGLGFILVLGALVSALSGISQDDAVDAMTVPVTTGAGGPVTREVSAAEQGVINEVRALSEATPDIVIPAPAAAGASVEADAGIAAAVASVPASIAGQRGQQASVAEIPPPPPASSLGAGAPSLPPRRQDRRVPTMA